MLLAGSALPAAAQYPGHTQKDDQKKPPAPRAISVLEWVGDPGKPTASRIVPVTVFVDGRYEDGGLYLARPAPLAVESDTLYDLEKAGVPQGTFDIAGGANVGGSWFGYGKWRPLAPPKPAKKLVPSKNLPRVIEDHDPDRPHFKGGDPASASGSSTGSKSGDSTSSTKDPDTPTLHRKTDSGSSDTAQDDPDKPVLHRKSDSSDTATGAGTAPDDPDRPHLKKRSAASASAAGDDDGAPVTSANEPDPDRPKMSRGKPVGSNTPLEATELSGLPPDLQQMTAVSDASTREEHAFTYQWPSPDDAARLQTAVEALAVKAVLADGAPAAAKTTSAKTSTGTPAARAGAPHNTLSHRVAQRPPPVVLSDKDYHSYELSYSGGPTLVLTAKATVGPNNARATLEKYVTIIAQPDFNGDPQVRLQSVTDQDHLDITPRMRLVDAVDTDGDNRAELVFELRRASDRQFAIYKVIGNHAEQAFATEALPFGSSSRAEIKPN